MTGPSRRELLTGSAATLVAASLPPPVAAQTVEKPSGIAPILRYTRPADVWVEALPVGNGRLGAMMFGGITGERLQLNEDTFFAGSPYDPVNPEALSALPEVRRLIFAGEYKQAQDLADAKLMGKPLRQMAYQPLGDVLLTFPGLEGVREYSRSLDLDGAIATTRFRTGSALFTRELFASAVDQVIVLRLTSNRPGSLTFNLSMTSPQISDSRVEGGNTIVLSGVGPTQQGVEGKLRFETRVRVLATKGSVTAQNNDIYVEQADEVVILISAATAYRRFGDISGDPAALAASALDNATIKPVDRLLADHQSDYRALFRRVSIDLGPPSADSTLTTDERIRRSAELADPTLAALYFQYGRYLLICSSRPGTQPANLQGIWNEKTNPSWGSKWTLNINAQMNYWPAEPTNLADCVEPLVRLIRDLSITGARTAQKMYGARGWVVHNNTDLWRASAPVDGAVWSLWPLGGAWLCQHLWDHYDYSRDKAFLADVYPLIKGCALFFLDTLVTDPASGYLVTVPSMSPENRHLEGVSICAGPAMDNQLLRDLFSQVAQAASLLGRDADLRRQMLATRAKLAPDKIGAGGYLQEWLQDWDARAPEQTHRHVSHLYALHPGSAINRRDTPELATAARRTLEIRTDDATGWGIGWRVNLWARLGDGERAYKVLGMLLEPRRTYPNMFDSHPPFQIDGNFGGTAGIAEMLVQSWGGEVHLLPALPRAWPTGHITGIRVRGDGQIDLHWQDGRPDQVIMRSGKGGNFTLRYVQNSVKLRIPAGGERRLRWDGAKLVGA
ncbi:glycoside hydrolase family 95 protein [Niveispirillum cyanobacteriorum]|uniref:Uncharacterized protein n=1 Tax=Niveispirillum cyanobacteriorum TaxID=1612173 RepID=A0A2K9NJD8_9PROT|nr:glycoside hydrolase family 95 protein [Niveispirillum cyanobacteriorum]AUN33199.1 hypothetical protein C0V82_22705 [Niveispirillum cyanobacteriorum]GGE50855.1 alpha/beta hydrolase [Niveispirillum cyanobacteriorum]